MADRPLRRILTVQAILIVVIPFLLMALVGAVWLVPLIQRDLESRQRELANAVGVQVQMYLTSAEEAVKASAHLGGENTHDSSMILDAHVRAGKSLSILYETDEDGRITAVGLPREQHARRGEFLGLDLSRNSLQTQVRKGGIPRWSDTFLSLISGGLSVAFAVPFPGKVVTGEVQLRNLSGFLRSIASSRALQILVLDTHGVVIADTEGSLTARQFNMGAFPLVRKALVSGQQTTGALELDGRGMTASIIHMPSIDWHVLVAQPMSTAYRTIWVTAGIASLGLLIACLLAIAASVYLSRRLAFQFEGLARQARSLAFGTAVYHHPRGSILEFNQLSDTLRHMATDLRERERDLVHAKEYTENLIHSANVIIMCLDETGAVTLFNRMAEKITGYAENELTGRDWFETAIPADIAPEIRAEFHRLRESGGEGTCENEIVTKDGERRTIAWRNCSVMYGGEHTGVLSFGIDVTEHRKADERLRQAARMESVGRLAGGVAHDFNNMLSVILGYTELSLKNAAEDDTLRRYLDEIRKAAEHSRDVTSQLLAFARRDPAFPRPIDMNLSVDEAKNTIELLMGEDTRVLFRPGADLWKTSIDPSQIGRILVNLAVNARDAMPRGGVLCIETMNVVVDEEFCRHHPDSFPGSFVKLTVGDTGTGMDEATLSHIFEPFFTTKEVGKGTGLGLATVYGIVTQNKGFISVHSEPGQGTSFDLYFPQVEAVPDEKPVPGDSRPSESMTVLLVEDNEMVLWMVARILEDAGYTVVRTRDPEEAISICAAGDAAIDLILTDVVMPKMNGREMVEKITALMPGVKCLYMSGYASDSMQVRGVDEEARHFIRKPFDIQQLRTKISEITSK